MGDLEGMQRMGGFLSSDEDCDSDAERCATITDKAVVNTNLNFNSRHAYARPAMHPNGGERKDSVGTGKPRSTLPAGAATVEDSAAEPLPKAENMLRDVDCTICFETMFAPIQLPCCNHIYCRDCLIHLKPLTDSKLKCPLCRRRVPEHFDPRKAKVFKPMVEVIQLEYRQELKEYNKLLHQKRKSKKTLKNLILQVGNEYRRVANPRKSRNGKHVNRHGWQVFVKVFDDAGSPLTENLLVRKVQYRLAPYFPNVTKYMGPYTSGWHTGWGYFDVEITVHWRRFLDKKPVTCSFELAFTEGGTSSTVDVPLSDTQAQSVLQIHTSKHGHRHASKKMVTPSRTSEGRSKQTGTWSRAPRDVPAR